ATFTGSPFAGVTVPPPFQSPLSLSKGLPAGSAASPKPGRARAVARMSAASGMAQRAGDQNKRYPHTIPPSGKPKIGVGTNIYSSLADLRHWCIMQKKRVRGKINETLALRRAWGRKAWNSGPSRRYSRPLERGEGHRRRGARTRGVKAHQGPRTQ